MDDSSNRSHLGAKSSLFQAKIWIHTRLYFMVALIKNTECRHVGPYPRFVKRLRGKLTTAYLGLLLQVGI